ncbi:type VII secretion target [Amycolatopsis lurida]
MSYEVEPEDLIAHASHLDGVTDRLNTALDAAKTVSMDDSAYGLLCSFLPPIVNPMEEKGMEAIGAAVEGVETTAGNVRKAAESYRESDKAHVEPLKKFQADAEGTKVVELAGSSGSTGGGGGSSPTGFSKAASPMDDGSTPAHQATMRSEPFQTAERQDAIPAHQAAMRPEPFQTAVRQDATPEFRATMRPEPFQAAERMEATPAHQAAMRPEPFQTAERQQQAAFAPAQQGEPMVAREAVQRPEPFQVAERQVAEDDTPAQHSNRII